jgi:hypothetical protein
VIDSGKRLCFVLFYDYDDLLSILLQKSHARHSI